VPDDSDADARELQKYLTTYLSTEVVQDPAQASSDSQLATIIPILVDRIGRSPSGSILDIGCGRGPLLARLNETSEFNNNPVWIYVGID
jgi:2-polyprenyl-3-methyl-5-hydroxy-6-metoxy-1,4-benzoquinol methylase